MPWIIPSFYLKKEYPHHYLMSCPSYSPKPHHQFYLPKTAVSNVDLDGISAFSVELPEEAVITVFRWLNRETKCSNEVSESTLKAYYNRDQELLALRQLALLDPIPTWQAQV